MKPAQLLRAILPDVLIDNFDIVNFDKSADRFDIYLDEKKVQLKEDKTNPDIISYGFGEYRTIQDYPIRGRATYLHVRKRKWLDKSSNEIFSYDWDLSELGISEAVDYDKYYLYSLITHSTAIEGSTLTELDTQLLFDEGVTAKGKPLVHHLMNEDLKQAYELAKVESDSLVPITPAFLKRMNAMLMRTTGSVHSVMGGSFDSSKGEFRLCGVTAGVGGHSYMNYLKVPAKVDELCAILQEKQKKMGTFREQYELSFNAHLNLVTIHPWVDGNGRTARLLMNYIQFCYHLFPTKIFKEDREEYILSLRQCQNEETNQPFLDFMARQLKKSLSIEIERFNVSRKKGFSFMF